MAIILTIFINFHKMGDSEHEDSHDSGHPVALGCPSDSVRKLTVCVSFFFALHYVKYDSVSVEWVCGCMHFVPCATQSEAGRAAVCQGCPGRELCLKQGNTIIKILCTNKV